MPKRLAVAQPPNPETGRCGQHKRESRHLVHDSLRSSRWTAIGPPVVLDVMKYEDGEDK